MVIAKGIKNGKPLKVIASEINNHIEVAFNNETNVYYETELLLLISKPVSTGEMLWLTNTEQKIAAVLCGLFFDRAADYVQLTENEVLVGEDG